MKINIIINKNLEAANDDESWQATAHTKGIGVKVSGSSMGNTLRNLQKKLKEMNKFSRIARTVIESRMGYHQVNVNFKEKDD